MKYLLNLPRFTSFEGEDDAATATATAAAAAAAAAAATGKTNSQTEFDTHLAQQRRKYEAREAALQKAQRELATQLETQKTRKGLSEEERTGLQGRIDELESQFLTEKEKAERTAQKERDTSKQQVEQLTKERDGWLTAFQTEVVNNQITRAAANGNAHDVDQISAIVRPMIQFKEVVDEDGQKTGKLAPSVRFPDIDTKTKAPIVMEYTVDETVARMAEMDKYANLFVDRKRSGIGGGKNTGGSPTGKPDLAKLAKEDPAAFRKLRKERPDLFYGKAGK